MKKSFYYILLLVSLALKGQDLKSKADENYQSQDWKKAEVNYSKYLKTNPQDSSAWYRLAYSQLQLGTLDKALKNFDQAYQGNFFPAYTLYQKSKAYALRGEEEKMYQTLNEAVKRGFSNFKLLESEKEWADSRESNTFLEVIQLTKENAFPCLTDSVRRHFDFWIGDWDVLVNGQKVGENIITLAEGGCAIHESYTTAGIFSGQSINYYNPLDRKWHQTWVASGGNVLDYTEIDREPGMIQFLADYLNPTGQVVQSRLTFIANEDGSVRQLFENSTDGGTTWVAGFDGHYVKKFTD